MALSSCFELSLLGGVVSLQVKGLCFLESPSVAVNTLSTTVLEHEHAPLYRLLQSQAGFRKGMVPFLQVMSMVRLSRAIS